MAKNTELWVNLTSNLVFRALHPMILALGPMKYREILGIRPADISKKLFILSNQVEDPLTKIKLNNFQMFPTPTLTCSL
jgi:hypothetical protein